MTWATRITLILGVPWTLFMAFWGLVMFNGEGRNEASFGLALTMLAVWLIPTGAVWTMLRLALGDRGSLTRQRQ